MSKNGLLETHFEGLKLINRGKVRDIYDLGEHLLDRGHGPDLGL